uniref:RING-type domain-containing protein n=1 Tax=Peronospora matthiolae TaxID=2874970 RepID=A0AAV1TU96_9STRA
MPFRSSIARLIDSKTSLPLCTIELQGPSRRLLKARHHDIDKMEIKTKSLTATLHAKAIKFTVYKLQIRSNARYADTVKWVLIKRYSEFFYFRQTLLKHVEKWDRQFRDNSNRSQCKEFALAEALLLPALQTPTFPRKHMRCDTDVIVKERQKKLQQFVREMLDAYTDISVYMYDSHLRNTRTLSNLSEALDMLEEFLEIPLQQKEINRCRTAAVLALEEVGPGDIASSIATHHTCCICLNEYNCRKEAGGTVKDSMVKLPCSHHFHEDCIIDWFNTSTTCPLCRKHAFTDAQRSFAVLIE